MTITIEVGNEAGGLLTTKRTVLRRDEFNSDEEMEAAAVEFIREAKRANEAALQGSAS